jgi:hypothetical protein
VNRLVNALIEHPQVIEQTAGREDARFGSLLDALGDAMFSGSELHRIQDDLQLRQHLETSYLPTISAPDWEHALSLTENRTAINTGWWTAMIAGTSGQFGLTAPQDGSGSGLVALFAGPPAKVRVLIYYPALGRVEELPVGRHCGPSSRGHCYEGACRGCTSRQVFDVATRSRGIKCMCQHRPE